MNIRQPRRRDETYTEFDTGYGVGGEYGFNENLEGGYVAPDLQLPAIDNTAQVMPLQSEQVELYPGVTANRLVNAPQKPTIETGRVKLGNDRVNNLIDLVSQYNNALTKFKYAPDGTVEVESAATPMPGEVQGGVRGTEPKTGLITNPDQYQAQFAPQPEEKGKSFFQKAGDFLSSPEFGYIAGQLGAAIAPNEQLRRLGEVGAGLNLQEIYADYATQLQQGKRPEELTDRKYRLLSPELRAQAASEALVQKKEAREEEKFGMEKEAFGLEKTAQDIRNTYMTKQAEYLDALRAGTLTAEQKQNQVQMDRAVQLALGEFNRNDWMGLGGGMAFNTRTGEFVIASDPSGGGSGIPVSKLQPADYKLFETWVSDNYLPIALENRRQEIIKGAKDKEEGKRRAESIDIIKQFQNKDGTLDVRAIKEKLTPEQKIKFAQDVSGYVTNIVQGVSPASTQVQQAQTANVVVEYEGQKYLAKPMPNGQYELLQLIQ